MSEGVSLIYNKMKNSLQQRGLKEMVAKGETFDSDIHEALTMAPAPSEELKGKVIDELEKGYYYNDKVIRHAKVVVGN
jgi:molecular chaperone GrpE